LEAGTRCLRLNWWEVLALRRTRLSLVQPSPTCTSRRDFTDERYFVHQRGFRLAIWVLAITISASVSGVISGVIIQNYRWQMSFKIGIYTLVITDKKVSVFLAVETVLLFLCCPETSYRRAENLNIDLGTIDYLHSQSQDKAEETTIASGSLNEPWTFREQLRLWRGIEADDNLLKIILRPFPLLLFPQVFYCFVTGLSGAWLSVLLGVTPLIFGNPPYNFSVEQLGLLCIGGIVASLMGFSAGPMNDWICKYMARRNNGVYEPEVKQFPATVLK
jgi:MFS family permease